MPVPRSRPAWQPSCLLRPGGACPDPWESRHAPGAMRIQQCPRRNRGPSPTPVNAPVKTSEDAEISGLDRALLAFARMCLRALLDDVVERVVGRLEPRRRGGSVVGI